MSGLTRTPDNGYYDTEDLFEFQQHNGDNSVKRNIPLYKYNQLGKLEAGNTQMGEPDINTIEDQTKYKISNVDADTVNNITGGNFASARISPGASSRQFSIGGKNVSINNIGNNMSKYSDMVKKVKTREGFGTDKPVAWSTMPTASSYQNGTAAEQLRAPDFVIDKANGNAAYDQLSMSKWREQMEPILNDYGNTLAKMVTFGAYKPSEKEGYCPGGMPGLGPRPSPLFGQIAAVLTVILILVIFFIIVQQVCVSACRKTKQETEDLL